MVKIYDATHSTLRSTTVRNLTPSSPGCSATSSGTRCTVEAPAPPGNDTFDVTTYDRTGGTGHALSATIGYPFAVAAGKPNSISLTLGGLAASFKVIAANAAQTTISASAVSIVGTQPQHLTILPVDAQGDTIVGAGAPQPFIDATPSSTTLTPSGPNTWTLTSTFSTSTNPATPGNSTLSVTATPFPGSGGTTLHKSIPLKLYQPWIYVMDFSNRLLYAFDESGTGKTFNTGLGITYAYGVGYVPATNWLYVPDESTGYMHVYDLVGNTQTPSASTPFPNLSTPYQGAYDSQNGLFYVANYGNSTITAYDAQGNQQTTPSPHFNFDGFLDGPDAIAYDSHNGFLYIANAGNDAAAGYDESSIQETDQSSTFLNLSVPSGVAFDSNNNLIYISSEGSSNNGVTAYNEVRCEGLRLHRAP